uniref:Uncharacterized protein n=1 Tax=Cannabis sativa TaxID=3483 RepID=A0A803QIV1_CANSA
MSREKESSMFCEQNLVLFRELIGDEITMGRPGVTTTLHGHGLKPVARHGYETTNPQPNLGSSSRPFTHFDADRDLIMIPCPACPAVIDYISFGPRSSLLDLGSWNASRECEGAVTLNTQIFHLKRMALGGVLMLYDLASSAASQNDATHI